jgi:hypothetical protein
MSPNFWSLLQSVERGKIIPKKLSILSSVESKNPKPVNHNSESEETLYLEQRGIKESQIRQSQ